MKFVILFLSFNTWATTKYYVTTDSKGNHVVIGASGFVPAGVIAPAPLDESGQPYPAEALEVSGGKVSVNKAKADAKKDKDKKDADDRLAKETEKTSRKSRLETGCKTATGLLKEICDELVAK